MFPRDFLYARINFFFSNSTKWLFVSSLLLKTESYDIFFRPADLVQISDLLTSCQHRRDAIFFFFLNTISIGLTRSRWFQWSMKGERLIVYVKEQEEIKKKKQELYLNCIYLYTLKSSLIETSRWHANARGTAHRNTLFLLIACFH